MPLEGSHPGGFPRDIVQTEAEENTGRLVVWSLLRGTRWNKFKSPTSGRPVEALGLLNFEWGLHERITMSSVVDSMHGMAILNGSEI